MSWPQLFPLSSHKHHNCVSSVSFHQALGGWILTVNKFLEKLVRDKWKPGCIVMSLKDQKFLELMIVWSQGPQLTQGWWVKGSSSSLLCLLREWNHSCRIKDLWWSSTWRPTLCLAKEPDVRLGLCFHSATSQPDPSPCGFNPFQSPPDGLSVLAFFR